MKKTATKQPVLSEKETFELLSTIQKNAAFRTVSASVGGKTQQRSNGERGVKNLFNHSVGTIGADIDSIIRNPLSGRFSKEELAAYCGTKTSKINSHLNNELTKKYGLQYSVNANGKLVYSFPAESAGAELLQSVKKYRF